jgi:hypothetical protein
MPKNLYTSITLNEFDAFLDSLGFSRRLKAPKSKEWVYAKVIDGTEFMIVIYSSMEVKGGHQRRYGEDAIRCQLQHADEKRPLMDLSATKRVRNWQSTLEDKIEVLEMLCKTAEPCSKCGADMRPIHGQFGSAVLWVCFRRHDELAPCKGVRYIESELVKKIAHYWPRS